MKKLGNPLLDAAYTLYRWANPVFDPIRVVRAVPRYPKFIRDVVAYRRMPGAERMRFADSYPLIHDDTETTPFDAHYFYQDIWAFRLIRAAQPQRHVDVGSRIDFVGLLSTEVPVTFVDRRPLEVDVPNLDSRGGDILAMPFETGSVESLSCLHVAEHIGLGRYGDPLDPQGTEKACAELARILSPGGTLYFALPVGKPRLVFNAHRVHSPAQIIEYFDGLELLEFAGIDDDGKFVPEAAWRSWDQADYACGLFRFTKPAAVSTE